MSLQLSSSSHHALLWLGCEYFSTYSSSTTSPDERFSGSMFGQGHSKKLLLIRKPDSTCLWSSCLVFSSVLTMLLRSATSEKWGLRKERHPLHSSWCRNASAVVPWPRVHTRLRHRNVCIDSRVALNYTSMLQVQWKVRSWCLPSVSSDHNTRFLLHRP